MLQNELLSLYNNVYFDKLTEKQKERGSRFLLSECPDAAKDVRVLFLNLNPQMNLPREEPNSPCLNRRERFWFDEGWNGADYFKYLFYAIGEKLENPAWSYRKSRRDDDWEQIDSADIRSESILAAYAYPLRTPNEEDLRKNNPNAARLSEQLWKKILSDVLPSRLKIVVTGNAPFDMVRGLLNAGNVREIKTDRLYRGRPSTIKFAEAGGRKILRFPQVTCCPLVGFDASDRSRGESGTDYAQAIDAALDFLVK